LPGAERILNQEEIDNLLGFYLNDDEDDENTGIRSIINSALVSYERLPMLEIVFDRLVRLMTTSLRNFTSDNVEVSLDSISSIRFGDYLNSIPLPAILAVFRAEELDNYGLMTVDSNLIYSIVDVLLGGRRGTAAMRIEGRPYTTIERALVQRMIEVVLADAKQAFEAYTAQMQETLYSPAVAAKVLLVCLCVYDCLLACVRADTQPRLAAVLLLAGQHDGMRGRHRLDHGLDGGAPRGHRQGDCSAAKGTRAQNQRLHDQALQAIDR
jgi:hypothetical protein